MSAVVPAAHETAAVAKLTLSATDKAWGVMAAARGKAAAEAPKPHAIVPCATKSRASAPTAIASSAAVRVSPCSKALHARAVSLHSRRATK